MSPRKPPPSVEVGDPVAAFAKAQALGRQVLAVPKDQIDAKLAREKTAKRKKRRGGRSS